MEKIINFSFIIPHKNTPDLLIRCVNSIPQRDDIEIIIVDDNSSPDIVDFNKFPCFTNSNVRVIFNKEAKGAGHARNIALPLAIGKWIIFADSDDFFNPCAEDILNDYVNSTNDIVFFNANSGDSNTLQRSNRVDHLHVFFSYNAGFNADHVFIDDREAYCVTSREGSLSQIASDEKLFCRFKIAAKWNKFLHDNGINLENKNFTYMLYQFSRKLYKNNKAFRKEYHALREIGYTRLYLWRIIRNNIIFTTKIKIHRILKS